MSIGERIVELRKKRNISQGQLAKMMDVTRQAVSKWENDLSSPDTVRLIHLADVLDTEVEYLATGSCVSKSPPEVVRVIETVEKVVEKPIIIQKTVEIERPVPAGMTKPTVKKVVRTKYVRNPLEFVSLGVVCFLFGLLIGVLIF